MDFRLRMPHPAAMDIFSIFGIRGRSKEVYRLEDALRAVGLHPKRVPDSVKLAALRLLKNKGAPDLDAGCAKAAPMLAFCMLGEDAFSDANSEGAAQAAEARLRHAIDCGDSLDAQLALLTLMAGVAEPGIVEKFELSVD